MLFYRMALNVKSWGPENNSENQKIFEACTVCSLPVPPLLEKVLDEATRCRFLIASRSLDALSYSPQVFMQEFKSHKLTSEQRVHFMAATCISPRATTQSSQKMLDFVIKYFADGKQSDFPSELSYNIFLMVRYVSVPDLKKHILPFFEAMPKNKQLIIIKGLLAQKKNYKNKTKILADDLPLSVLGKISSPASGKHREASLWWDFYKARRAKSSLVKGIPLKSRKKIGVFAPTRKI